MAASLGNEPATEANGADQPMAPMEPQPVVMPLPKRAYYKPVLKRLGLLRSVTGSGTSIDIPG
jgi:hypothetical protein